MKECPACHRSYIDETLNFCLDDGEWLRDAAQSTNYPTATFPSTPIEEKTKIFGVAGLSATGAVIAEAAMGNSIAVLPFVNISADADNEYFCEGLAEELLNALAKIEGLKVAARTSAFSFKGKNANVSEIGTALGVNTILEGSVRRSGERLRISVQLINASDGYHLWSERYDREMRDIFAVQDEITLAVTTALKRKLLGEKNAAVFKHHTKNTEAYELYLQGRFFLNKFTAENFEKALEYFNAALAMDETYALAYAGLADTYAMLTEMGPLPPTEAMPKAKEMALKAIALDEDLAEAHSALGMILQDYDYDFAGAEKEFKHAIELNPNNPMAHRSYGILLVELGRETEAFAAFQKALEVDPLSVLGNWIYSFALFLTRRYDDCLEQAKKTLELDPGFGLAYLSLAFAYQMKGEYTASVGAYAKCGELCGFPENAAFVLESFAAGGWKAFLKAMTGPKRPFTFSSYIIAVFYATLGDTDGAFAELEASFEKRESHIVMMKADPRFDGLRGDPRFPELLSRIGFP